MKCTHKECENEATHVPVINVPATGYAIDVHEPMKVLVGIELCEEHVKEFKVEYIVPSLDCPLVLVLKQIAASESKVELDWERAFVEPISLDSNAYRTLAESRERH